MKTLRGVGIMSGSKTLGATPARPWFDELTLDQLLAEPMVRQLMRRHRIDAATIRRLMLEIAALNSPDPAYAEHGGGGGGHGGGGGGFHGGGGGGFHGGGGGFHGGGFSGSSGGGGFAGLHGGGGGGFHHGGFRDGGFHHGGF